jgi:hypothetical protein
MNFVGADHNALSERKTHLVIIEKEKKKNSCKRAGSLIFYIIYRKDTSLKCNLFFLFLFLSYVNNMAIRVVEFSSGGYKIRKIFA